MIKEMGNDPINDSQTVYLNNNIRTLRNQLTKLMGNIEVSPFLVFHEVYNRLIDELKGFNNYYQLNIIYIINNLSYIPSLEMDKFSNVYQKIGNFKRQNKVLLLIIFILFLLIRLDVQVALK